MSALAALPIDVARALAIAGVATAAGAALGAIARRRLALAAIALCLAMPPIAIAYAWAATPGLHRVADPAHVVLAALRLAPLALAVALIAPPAPLGARGLHCERLAGAGAARLARRWWLQGPGRRWLIALLALMPLAFAEFEIGARFAVGAWAVRLFDAQAGGRPVSATLIDAAPGVAVQLAALIGAGALMRRRGAVAEAPPEPGRARRIAGWSVLGAAVAALVVAPLARLLPTIDVAALDPAIARELAATALFAVAAATCAWALTAPLAGRRPWLIAALLAPGLCGSLVIGLLGLATLRATPAAGLATTPLPLLIALVAIALPFALTARVALAAPRSASVHVAALLASGSAAQRSAGERLRWRASGRFAWLAWTLVMWWCAGDLAASSILHPIGMTPALVLLYNFMHYGESAALTSRLVLAVVAPLAIAAAAYAAMRGGHRLLHGGARG
ncbi:MAG TPA: hypothetical protein VEL07_05840 [Planctomycetota bacterium]|nr:hypothetical protein [Planctomycetota bacterium]